MMTKVYLLNHVSTVVDQSHPPRLQGSQLNLIPSKQGIDQARALQTLFANEPISACYTSPLLRALITAKIVSHPHNIHPITLPELSECDLGLWEGMDWQQIRFFDSCNYLRFFGSPQSYQFPLGESIEHARQRIVSTMSNLLLAHSGQTTIVVSHPLISWLYLSHLQAKPLEVQAILQCPNLVIAALITECSGLIQVESNHHFTLSSTVAA